MKKLSIVLLAALVVLGTSGIALATNGYQLIGVGQKQKSMGGAVTAAPMDAMTAVMNPAGMSRVGRRADFSMELFMPKRTVDFTATGGQKTDGGTDFYGIPAIGWTAPAFGTDNIYFGGGMYGTSGLGVDYGEILFMPGAAMGPGMQDVTFDGYSAIQFWKMAPTVAMNVNDRLSIGASFNMDYQSITVRQKLQNVPFWNNPQNPMMGVTQRDVVIDLGRPTSQLGYGASVGIMYDVADWLTVGADYVTKQYFEEAEYRVGSGQVMNFNGALGLPGIYELDLDYPRQAAAGVAIKPMEKLLVAFDVKWINWSDTHDAVAFRGPANSFDTNGDGQGDTNETALNFGWEDQIVFALGLHYEPIEALQLHAGYNYADSPIDEADVFNNLVFPATVEHHYTVGANYELGDHWSIGATYMRAVRHKITGEGDVPQGFQQATPFGADSNSEISLKEDSLGLQISYRMD